VADPGSGDEFDAVQIELLQRHRAGTTDGRVQRSIYLTINGIAVGLKNSG
jgi:phosphoenolpyruvate carboxylase